jgi:hypothetical protein
MKEESLFIVCERKDGFVTTWSEMMSDLSVMQVIDRVKYLKNWMGGKFLDIHTMCGNEKFTYNVNDFQNLIKE